MSSKKPRSSQAAVSRAVTRQRPKLRTAPARAKSTRSTVYQLKITLNDIRPPIWRRVQTKDCTLGRLHDIIQAVMGWDDYHLHEFVIGPQRYGAAEQWHDDFWGDEPEMGNERKVKIGQLVEQSVKKIRYQYDMGDSWWHTITVEKTLPAEAGIPYPRCIAGERACPPEDCGGPWSYGDFVAAIQNPKHERHEERLEWIGGDFDPEAFDLEAANEELQELG
jgi:Plasmid pRiA4b ORF-3-like protein